MVYTDLENHQKFQSCRSVFHMVAYGQKYSNVGLHKNHIVNDLTSNLTRTNVRSVARRTAVNINIVYVEAFNKWGVVTGKSTKINPIVKKIGFSLSPCCKQVSS